MPPGAALPVPAAPDWCVPHAQRESPKSISSIAPNLFLLIMVIPFAGQRVWRRLFPLIRFFVIRPASDRLRCGAVPRRRLRQAFRTADAAFRGCRPTFSDPGGSVLPARLLGAEKIRFLHLPALRQLPGESPRLRPVFRLKLRGRAVQPCMHSL